MVSLMTHGHRQQEDTDDTNGRAHQQIRPLQPAEQDMLINKHIEEKKDEESVASAASQNRTMLTSSRH
jgi:hypothetical protein